MKKKKNKKVRKIFGYHLAIDLFDCDPDVIKNMEKCYVYLSEIPNVLKTNIQSPPFIFYKQNIGLCGWIPIVESGISLYIDFSKNFASTDIYSCTKFDPKEVKDFVVKFFKPKKVKEYYIVRGKKYIHPTKLLEARGLI